MMNRIDQDHFSCCVSDEKSFRPKTNLYAHKRMLISCKYSKGENLMFFIYASLDVPIKRNFLLLDCILNSKK